MTLDNDKISKSYFSFFSFSRINLHEQFGTKIITYTVSKTIPALKYLRFLLTTYPRLVGYSTVFVFIIFVQAYISTMSTSHDMAE